MDAVDHPEEGIIGQMNRFSRLDRQRSNSRKSLIEKDTSPNKQRYQYSLGKFQPTK